MGMLQTADAAAARAALVMDLVAAGVRHEVADAAYPWLAPPTAARAESPQPQILVPKVVPARPERAVPLLAPRKAAGKARAPSKGHVWRVGNPGGLTVAVRVSPAALGQVPLAGAELDLLHKMLRALGYEPKVDAWVGLGQMDDMVRPELCAEMAAAVGESSPAKVLVLGQAALGTLLNASCGVEAWQASPKGWDGVGLDKGGVTYPPQLLLEKPVFKRLAWQHLLAWRARNEGGVA